MIAIGVLVLRGRGRSGDADVRLGRENAGKLLAYGFGLTTAVNYAICGLADWPLALSFIVGGLGDGVAGTRAARHLSNKRDFLTVLFAYLIFVVAAYMLWRTMVEIF